MSYDAYLRPWSGFACRHISAGASYDILDFRLAGQNNENRWNVLGEPMLYLASDHRVAIAEFARHFRDDRAEAAARQTPTSRRTIARRIYDLRVRIERALDLRDPTLCAALALADAPFCFLNRDVARTTAQFLRQTTPAQALLVPSVALLDQPEQHALVLFLEKLPLEPRAFITSVQPDGAFRFGDAELVPG